MKRIISTFMCIVILFTFVPLCVHAADQNVVPIIHIYGFMSSQIYATANDPDSERLFPMEKDAIVSFVKDLLPAVSALSISKNWVKFGDRLIPALNTLLLPIANDDLGVPMNGTGPVFSYPSPEEIKADPSLRFVYDWRDDPFVSAEQLNQFISYVTDTCGYERVSLECHSYGGIVTLTYLSTYGTQKIQSCCFNATAVYGATFAGQLMQGKVHLSADALTAFLEGIFDGKEYAALLQAVVAEFDELGGTRFLCNFINQIFEHLEDRIWAESIFPVFTHWLSVWAMVPDDLFSTAQHFVFSSPDADADAFLEKAERFNREVRSQREARLRAIDQNCNLYVIARYGYSGVPLEEIWEANTDGVLDTRSESFGAVCKPFSYYMPPTHVTPFLSPNGAIDASTCLFPRQTWFVRGFKHTQKDPAMDAFTATLLRSKTQMTIDSDQNYPQFLYFDKVLRAVRADSNQIDAISSWSRDLLRLLRTLFYRLLDRLHIPYTIREVRAAGEGVTRPKEPPGVYFVPTVNPGMTA